jgi:hypothetical protein
MSRPNAESIRKRCPRLVIVALISRLSNGTTGRRPFRIA